MAHQYLLIKTPTCWTCLLISSKQKTQLAKLLITTVVVYIRRNGSPVLCPSSFGSLLNPDPEKIQPKTDAQVLSFHLHISIMRTSIMFRKHQVNTTN